MINKRCPWAESDEIFFHYHDHEWGVPKYDPQVMFNIGAQNWTKKADMLELIS